MEHRHLFSTSQSFEMDQNQNRNHMHAEQPYLHLGRVGVLENGSFVSPIENVSTGVHLASHWNTELSSSEYPSSSLSLEVPHYQVATSGPAYDPFLHSPATGSFRPLPQNYAHHASSSSYYSRTIQGAEGGAVIPTMDNGRVPCKRKSPPIPVIGERGSASRYYGAGSSSHLSVSPNLQQEKPNSVSQRRPRDTFSITPSYRGHNLSITADDSPRNVRSRSSFDLESNLTRSRLSNNPSLHPHSIGHPINHSGMLDLPSLSANATTRVLDRVSVPHLTRGRIPASDAGGLGHATNQFRVRGSTTNGSANIGGCFNDLNSSRNPIVPLQNIHCPPTQAVRGGLSSYSQRSGPAYRATSSNPHLDSQRAVPAYRATSSNHRLGYMATSSEDGLLPLSEIDSSRHSQPLSTVGWRNSDRNGRSRMIAYERFRSLSDVADANDRLVFEGLMTMERSTFYGSRNLLDQHRDMRLDVDNMSYEELLVLEESIGNVNTGLCGDMMSKCLTKTIYCSSDLALDEETCAICLEEYKNKEEVGTLKNCGHDYHVGCIKKWLSMKNVCPICKASALEDGSKEK